MSERGKLLFKLPSIDARSRYVWLAWMVLMALLLVEAGWLRTSPNWFLIALFVVYGVAFYAWRRAGIYENGIRLPADLSGNKGRFILWSQIERFHWEGDVLTIVPTSAMMAGPDLERPLTGGALRVPENTRAQLARLLAQSAAGGQKA